MNDRTKMNLEDLKKSFPSLDDHATKKILGGWVDPNSKPDPDVPSTGSNPGGTTTGGTTASTSHPTSAGGMYFGDSDYDQGDGGWGDWGDDGPGGDQGGDSNPGGSEVGNGQNSSGNPGTGQTTPDYSNLEFINNTNTSVFESRTYNNSSQTLYGKPDYDTPYDRVIVPPGGFTDVPLDAFKVDGHVYKVTDGYGTLTVHDSFYTTMYSDDSILWFDSDLERMQEWLQEYGNPCQRTDFGVNDTQWDNIFLPP